MTKQAKLTAKEEQACQQFLITGNQSEAYRQAYNAENMKAETINVKASQLFAKDKVRVRVQELQAVRAEENKISADYVLKRLIEIDEMDVADILDNVGNFKSILEWPQVWRRTLSGMDIQEMVNADVETVMRKIKWPDKLKNLELLGKHIDIQAFKEQKEISGNVNVGYEEKLTAARKRLEKR